MDHSIRVVYDEEILKKGVRVFVCHRLCKGFGYLGLAVLLLVLPVLWIAGVSPQALDYLEQKVTPKK